MTVDKISELRTKERQKEIQSFVRICSSKLSMPLYLVFWAADLLYAPQLKWEFLGLRLLSVFTCLLINHAITNATHLLQVQLIGGTYTFVNSILITVMIFWAEGSSSPYYAGLNLVTIGIMGFIPWTRAFVVVNGFIIFGPFLIWSLATLGPASPNPFLLNCFFLAGTLSITMVIRYSLEKIRLKELRNRLYLHDVIKSRDSTIKERTTEALRLSSLTKQFSPQVVHAIKSGKLDVLESIHHTKICAIFIDIVNSTSRVARADKDDINKVISLFMEDTMKVLLKYDITIDKFLGDGVLGFCNDPIPHDDYNERVADAACEIRERIQDHQEQYIEHWLNELQIRVGIASGLATVGFYGSDEYFRSYTAIGRVVNLASRLCSAAQPNQILVSHEVFKDLPEGLFTLNYIGTQSLKGFESDLIRCYELVESKRLPATGTSIETCPYGHGVLHLDTDGQGIYVFKCRACGHSPGSATPAAA
jgi:adenylate cyclase